MTQSSLSYFTGFRKDNICCLASDVRRYKWFAECANCFLRDVESGCSPLRCLFNNPLVRKPLEGKTLEYKMVQGSIFQRLHIQSMCVEGRGVEATLESRYEDRKTVKDGNGPRTHPVPRNRVPAPIPTLICSSGQNLPPSPGKKLGARGTHLAVCAPPRQMFATWM